MNMSLEICMDIFDWFDDSLYGYINHTLLSKLDGEQRIQRALPYLWDYAMELVERYQYSELAYPVEYVSNHPA